MGIRTAYPRGHFSWVDLTAADLAAVSPFYEAVFEWKAVPQNSGGEYHYVIFELNGHWVAGAGQRSDDMAKEGVPPCWNSYVTVDQLDATVEHVSRSGGGVVLPAVDIGSLGRMAVVTDPEGASLFLWQAGDHPGAGWVNHPGGFCWNELATRDMEAARSFYGEVFGWTFEDNPASPSDYSMIRNAGRMNGGIIRMTEEWGDVPARWSVYFSVEDIEKCVAVLKELGGEVFHGPFVADPVGKMAMVADPQGAHFCLIELNSPDE